MACVFCNVATDEPAANPSAVTDALGNTVSVCPECRTKARRRELVNSLRPPRRIVLRNTVDPRIAIAQGVEHMYTFAGIRAAIEAQSCDAWTCIDILHERLVEEENTNDRSRDAQQYRELFIQKLIAMPDDGELHFLVSRGQAIFRYRSAEVERQVKEARPVEQAVQDEVEPWDDPVDGAAVLDEVAAKVTEFVIATAEQIDAIAPWTCMTHCFQLFDFAAYLLFQSPEPRCAKTRGMDVVAPMAAAPLVATHMKPETLFRALQAYHLIPFLDEAHLYIRKSDDHEAVLNGGFQKGKPVWRCTGDNYVPTPFDIYAPKCLASIGPLQFTISDRSVVIHMRRKNRDEHVRHWVQSEVIEREELRPIRRRLKRWVLDHLDALREAIANPALPIPQELYANDRHVDIWRPLFVIADVAGGSWPDRARRAAIAVSAQNTAPPETIGVELLRNIRTLYLPPPKDDGTPVKGPDDGVFSVSELCTRLVRREEWAWASYGEKGKGLTTYSLTKFLKGYGIEPEQHRVRAGDRKRGYWLSQFEPVWARYIPEGDSSAETPETSESGESPPGGATQPIDNSDIFETQGDSRDGETRGVPQQETGESGNGNSSWADVDPEVFSRATRRRQ